MWYSILFIILLCRINILNDFFEIDFLKNIASIIIIINLIVNIENNQIDITIEKVLLSLKRIYVIIYIIESLCFLIETNRLSVMII